MRAGTSAAPESVYSWQRTQNRLVEGTIKLAPAHKAIATDWTTALVAVGLS